MYLLSNNEFSILKNRFRWRKIAQVNNYGSYLSRSAKNRDSAIFSNGSKSSIVSFLMEECGDDKIRSCIKRLEKQYLNCLLSQISECCRFLPHVSLTLLVIFKQAAF